MKAKPEDQSFDAWRKSNQAKRDKSPGVVPKSLSKKLKKRFGDNWNREYSPTGDIGGELDKMRKIKKVRKGGPVGHRVGEQVTPNSMGGNLAGGVLGGPQMNPSIPPPSSIPSPPSVQKRPASVKKQPSQQDKRNKNVDAINKFSKLEADQIKYKKIASLGKPQGKPKAPGMPQAQGKPQDPRMLQGKPQDPRMLQGKPQPQPQRPPVLSRKGDTVKPQSYKRGGKVGIKGYSNVCRVANNPVA